MGILLRLVVAFLTSLWGISLNTLSDGHPSPTQPFAANGAQIEGLNTLSDGHPSPTVKYTVIAFAALLSKYPL